MGRWESHLVADSSYYEHEIYDYDVLKENLRVHHTPLSSSGLVLRNLTKTNLPEGFKKVNNLCIKVEKGECFCLLGVAGAGKTATLRMIVGSLLPTAGDVTMEGHSLMRNYPVYTRQFGYCPYHSPFLKELTGQEVITLIGTLRRIPPDVLDGLVTNLSLRLLFLQDLDNFISTYSPNAVRKLSAAVSMIGDPKIVVLDEPTTNIDLMSREHLFKSINTLVKEKGSIVLLTSRRYLYSA
jgi:ABC-type multidrug transport system ATPase subunit